MMVLREIRAIPIPGIGELRPGDSLSQAILGGMARAGLRFQRGDLLVVKHKIVSKAEGRVVRLDCVRPSAAARHWARRYRLDARVVQLGLDESTRMVRKGHGVMITETRHGLICANSGVDVSNVDGGESAVLLPADPDRSAARLRREISAQAGFSIPVIISDSFGRPWREGLTEVAVGAAGMKVFHDLRGRRDRYGYTLRVTVEAVADELAGMAGLACPKLALTPACIIRGFKYEPGRGRARDILRPAARDLFR